MIPSIFEPTIVNQPYYQILTCCGYKFGKIAMMKLSVKVIKAHDESVDETSWIKFIENCPTAAKIKTGTLIFPFVTDGLHEVCKVYFFDTNAYIRAGHVGDIYDTIFCYILD